MRYLLIAALTFLSVLATGDLAVAGDNSEAARIARVVSAKDGDPAMLCRRVQRSAQSVIAANGYEALVLKKRSEGKRRIAKKPRRFVRRMVGEVYRSGAVTNGCYRCIARQFVRGVPLSEQIACGLHDPCVAGCALDPQTDACAAAVCETDPACCTSAWDEGCIEGAKTACELECEECSHGVCQVGFALADDCNSCTSAICATDPFCCDTLWSGECVAKVESVCGQPCLGGTTTTIPGGTTTTIVGPTTTIVGPTTTVPGATTTVPGGTTIPGGTTTTAPGATTTTIVGPTTTLPPACTGEIIFFEDQKEGEVAEFVETDLGTVIVKGTNPKRDPNANLAIIYESDCVGGCTGGDPDLGTPNQAFGGPGVGTGGASGPAANDTPLGNILIVGANKVDLNRDDLVDNPSDQSHETVLLEIDFSEFAPVRLTSVDIIDIESSEPGSIELFNMIGASLGTVALPSTGDNGVLTVTMPDTDDVWKMIVTLRGSGAIDNVAIGCPPSTSTTLPPTTTIPGGTTTTVPGGTTTTVPGGTTTTVPGATTTVPGGTTTVPGGTTTTIVPVTTTIPPGTTTIPPGTTTTIPVTTTTIPPGTTVPPTTSTVPPATTTTVPIASACPDTVELFLLASTRNECTTNADCEVGTCNQSFGRCQTQTELDTGWTGIGHDADITDDVRFLGNVDCPGEGPVCGQCTVLGINPEPNNCRCANDNRAICDQPFAVDADSCGAGVVCNCYLGPPLSLSAGNTPACVVNRMSQDVTGTTNVDTGAGGINVQLRSVVFLGESLDVPCPYCTGDDTPGDGARDGDCVLGPNADDPCDADGVSLSFPAPGGDGASLDCFPTPGKNVSGEGLIIKLNQTTGSAQLNSDVPCGFPAANIFLDCHCGVCSGAGQIPCESDAECVTATTNADSTCTFKGNGDPLPNQCNTGCVDVGGGEGECTSTGDNPGPSDKGCDGLLRANGEGFIQCSSNADCDPVNIGLEAGDCTLEKRRQCFLPTIVAQGDPDPKFPLGVATFCVPPTASGAINSVAGLPGPGRVKTQGETTARCGTDVYVPGVGCP